MTFGMSRRNNITDISCHWKAGIFDHLPAPLRKDEFHESLLRPRRSADWSSAVWQAAVMAVCLALSEIAGRRLADMIPFAIENPSCNGKRIYGYNKLFR